MPLIITENPEIGTTGGTPVNESTSIKPATVTVGVGVIGVSLTYRT